MQNSTKSENQSGDQAPSEIIRRGRCVGLLLHSNGTLRFYQRGNSRVVAEVVGFDTDRGRAFLEQLEWMPDLLAEVLVCSRPELYGVTPADLDTPHWFHRRDQ